MLFKKMVKYVKNGWLSKTVDSITLGSATMLGGYALFGLEKLKDVWGWFGDTFTTQLLPNTLSTYDFPSSVGEAFGLGALPLFFAILISVLVKDDDILDNPKQMALGMLAGLICTVGLIYVDVSPSAIQSVGFVGSIVMMSLYALFRRSN